MTDLIIAAILAALALPQALFIVHVFLVLVEAGEA